MSKKARKIIWGFVLGVAVLLVVAVLIIGSGKYYPSIESKGPAPPREVPVRPPPPPLPPLPQPKAVPLPPPIHETYAYREVIAKKILLTPLFWNLWAQDKPYKSLEVLKKNETYTIALDLSAIKYPFKEITAEEPGLAIIDLVTKNLTSTDEIKLIAYLLPDTKYFKNPVTTKRIRDFKISVKKIRDFKDPGIPPEQIIDHLREKGQDSEYAFGHVELELQTEENAEPGWGSVAVVLFDYNSKRPLDEIVAHFCIENCDGKQKPQTAPTSLKGFDIINAAAEKSSLPDASLYFLEFEESIRGVFCDNSDRSSPDLTCFTWNTKKTEENFNNAIKNIVKRLKPFSSEQELRKVGYQISCLMFPYEQDTAFKEFKSFVTKKISSSDFRAEEFKDSYTIKALCDKLGEDGFSPAKYTIEDLNELLKQTDLYSKIRQKKIEAPSEKLLKLEQSYEREKNEDNLKRLNRIALEESYPQETPKSQIMKYSIFLRAVTSGGKLAPFLPLGLALFKYKESEEAILGDYFRIVSPLPAQSYSIKKDCIPTRVALLPQKEPKNKDLEMAVAGMESLYAEGVKLGGKIYYDLSEFDQKYLRDPLSTNKSTALFILSHHANNAIYFEDPEQYSISADEIRITFASPSLSILNACGTGEPDASEFVYKLNSLGVETIIATSSSIDAFTAGKFFYCINKELMANKAKKDYPVSLLFDSAIECLRGENNYRNTAKIGANAFKYVLLGNGDLHFCPE